MKKILGFINCILVLSVLFFSYKIVKPNEVEACCSNAACAPNGVCSDYSLPCPGSGEGVCFPISQACSGSNPCPSGQVCDTGACTPAGGGATPPPSGGGGFQGQTCTGGTTLTCGTPNLYISSSDGTLTNDFNLSQCIPRATCDTHFPSVHTMDGCDGVVTKGYCQDNCGCCAPGSTYNKTQTTGSNYTKETNCQAPSGRECNDWDDIFVSRRAGAASGNCYCNCPDDENGCGGQCNRNGGNWIKNDLITCTSVTTTWACVSSCTTSTPSAPSLSSPSNGIALSTTTNNLTWSTNGQTWGTGCPTNNNNYYLYIGPTAGSLALAGSVTQASGTSSIPVTRSAGIYYWQVRASNGSLTTNSPVWSFTITDAEPWWQVKDGDLTTNGDISSGVITGQLFDTIGLGGFPGVPVYGNAFNLSSDTSKISATAWHADTTTIQSRIFNYAFFDNLIPNDVNFNDVSTLVSGGASYTDGYEWYTATGDVNTSGDINIGNRKVILFVENGNFNINGRINVNDGVGFFGVFVDGNISIDPAVVGAPSIEGIYLSSGSFSTGTGTSQLHIRGSVATFGTVNLQRDLTVDTTPAELFEFAPDQMLLFPEKLMFRRTKWTEVAP